MDRRYVLGDVRARGELLGDRPHQTTGILRGWTKRGCPRSGTGPRARWCDTCSATTTRPRRSETQSWDFLPRTSRATDGRVYLRRREHFLVFVCKTYEDARSLDRAKPHIRKETAKTAMRHVACGELSRGIECLGRGPFDSESSFCGRSSGRGGCTDIHHATHEPSSVALAVCQRGHGDTGNLSDPSVFESIRQAALRWGHGLHARSVERCGAMPCDRMIARRVW